MALIERLMGLEEPKIPVHDFFAAQQEIVYGTLTAAALKNYLGMDAAAAAYFNKSTYIQRIHAVFILAEERYPGYSTPAEVRSKLGL